MLQPADGSEPIAKPVNKRNRRRQRQKMKKLQGQEDAERQAVSHPNKTADPIPGPSKEPARPMAKPGLSKKPVKEAKGVGKETGKGAASAKRARPNETQSPSGGPKRQKLNQSRGSKPASYAAAVKQSSNIEVAITSQNKRFVTREVATRIERFLEDKIDELALNDDPNIDRPAFCGRPLYREGGLRLFCANADTVQWLTESITSFPSNEPLVALKPGEVPNRVRIGILLPHLETDRTLVGRRFGVSNKWANVKQWLVHAMHQQVAHDATFLTLSVPEDIVPGIMERGRVLNYRLGAVYVKFRDDKGRYTDIPPGVQDTADKQATVATSTPLKAGPSSAGGESMDTGPNTETVELDEEELLGLKELQLVEKESHDGVPITD